MHYHSKEETAKIIKAGRIAKGYTQQEVADLAGISLRSVQRIENAEVIPRLYTYKVLAQKLALPEELGFNEADHASAPDTVNVLPMVTFNKPRKIILSVTTGLLITLMACAYLAQSVTFPETSFELFVFLIVLTGLYATVLFKIWE